MGYSNGILEYVYNRITYITKNDNLSIHQYASKQTTGAEDCIKDIVNDINVMQNNQYPSTLHTKDAIDACNNMKFDIIMDKFRYHVGLDDAAMTMFNSIASNISSVCIIDSIQSKAITPTNSLFSQGYNLSSLVWCIYINPAILYIDDNYKINGGIDKQMVATIKPKVMMDDISIYAWINENYWNNNNGKWDKSNTYIHTNTNKFITPITFIKYKNNKRFNKVNIKLIDMMQNANDFIEQYLHLSNIPTNDKKCHTITFDDWYYQQLQQVLQIRRKHEPELIHIRKRIINANMQSMNLTMFKQKLINKTKLDGSFWTKEEILTLIKYAGKEKVWSIHIPGINKDNVIIFQNKIEFNIYIQNTYKYSEVLNDYIGNHRHHTYAVNGEQKQQVDTVKILGIILDKRCTLNKIVAKT